VATSDPEETKPTLTIRPKHSWIPTRPSELWSFRELALRFAARDLTLRYRQTALGVVWVVMVPLLSAGILTFVFGGIADLQSPNGIPYYIFTLSGMVAWTLFSQVTLRSSAVLLGNAALVSKVFFPRLLLPISTVLSTLVDVAVCLALLVVLQIAAGIYPGEGVILLPIWFFLIAALALGIGLLTGALVVRYRDVGYILPVAIQFFLFASPVAYTIASVPPDAQFWYQLNPLSGLLANMRTSLTGVPRPESWTTIYSSIFAVVMLIIGIMAFTRMERQFADVI
jgi:lipopolysaccharide transport system permease protein